MSETKTERGKIAKQRRKKEHSKTETERGKQRNKDRKSKTETERGKQRNKDGKKETAEKKGEGGGEGKYQESSAHHTSPAMVSQLKEI